MLRRIHVYGHPVEYKKKATKTKARENEPQLATSAFKKSGSVSAARFVIILSTPITLEKASFVFIFLFFLFGAITRHIIHG